MEIAETANTRLDISSGLPEACKTKIEGFLRQTPARPAAPGPMPARQWYAHMPAPSLNATVDEGSQTVLRHFAGIQSDIDKPSLSDNLLVIHLSGPKRIRRWQGGRIEQWDVERDSVTLMPSFQHNRWTTEGPIDFAHLTLGGDMLSGFARETFDRDPRDLTLLDRVGQNNPLVSQLLLGLLRAMHAGGANRLYTQSLLTSLLLTLLRDYAACSTPFPAVSSAASPLRGGLAAWQKRRVLHYMAEHLGEDIGITELVKLTGLSRAHFFRAFRQSTGQSPQRHLTALRMQRAKHLLGAAGLSVEETAPTVGFSCPRRFCETFRREVGVAARLYRCSL